MPVDLARRRAVMARSQKLGHCICNPQHPCPCPMLIEHNVCPCAGERLPIKKGAVALTRHVRRAGCASKIGQADLLRILKNLPETSDPNVLVGAAAGDDAGVYRLNGPYALVQTVDVFTPCVDDPYLFGQIAAANSLSDVYAMGGRPITALSIIGFPIDELDGAIMEALLQGGLDKLAEARCACIGGHSINDEEVKCGFAVTGLIEVDKTVRRDAAVPGDVLVLTKPLGTGMVSFAAQLGRVRPACLDEVGAAMATLNKDAGELMVEHGAHACTDITGFGMAGHLVEMVRRGGVNAEIDLARVPVFAAVPQCIEADVLSGAVERNQEYAMTWVTVADSDDMKNTTVLYDPQTSGGLLIALPEDKAERFVGEMRRRGHAATTVIGRIVRKPATQADGAVIVVNARLENLVGTREALTPAAPPEYETKPLIRAMSAEVSWRDEPPKEACCDAPPEPELSCCDRAGSVESKETSVDALTMFKDFMKEANKPGLIDQRNKKLMAIALSIAQRCKPCLEIHMKSALQMGISKAEIDEAAQLAIAFGGCTAMMFYKEVSERIGQ